jgi:hypothetical protein
VALASKTPGALNQVECALGVILEIEFRRKLKTRGKLSWLFGNIPKVALVNPVSGPPRAHDWSG